MRMGWVGSRVRRLCALLVAMVCVACGGRRGVVRIVDGREVRGRVVSAEAYALYERGAFLEATGQPERALASYHRVLDYDPLSIQAWVRIGALRCPNDPDGAANAFAAAAALDDQYEPLWRERARCELRRGDNARGLSAAQRAERLDPDHVETSLLVVEALQATGDSGGARRRVQALVLRSPESAEAWRGALSLAEQQDDSILARQARLQLERLRPDSPSRSDLSVVLGDIDGALLDDDLDRARALAVRGGVPPAEVALRAAALAHPKLARDQALLVLRADPRSADAWIAALVAADLDRDLGLLEEVAAQLDADPRCPSSLGARLLTEVLGRLVGGDGAEAWSTARGPLPEPAEQLERRVADRSDL